MAEAAHYRSARLVRMVGGVLALILGIALTLVLRTDYTRRIDAARAQNMAIADGGQRLLSAQLRNLQRAMEGIAADGSQLMATVPLNAPALISENMAGVASRQAEIADLLFVDANGKAITAGEGDPSLPAWTQDRATRGKLRLGPLESRRGQWVLPLAVPAAGGRWVLARLRQSQLQDIVEHLHVGAKGAAAITDRYGKIIARTGNAPGIVGDSVGSLFEPFDPGSDRRVSRIDGVDRMVASSGPDDHALWVGVGVATASVLGPWYRFALFSIVLYLVYCIGFVYLYRHLLAVERTQVREIVERMQIQAKLTEAEARFRLAFDKNPLPYWIFDTATLRFLEVNEAAVRNYGYSREEFLAMRITDIRSIQDAEILRGLFASPVPPDEIAPGKVWVHRRKDGTTLDVRIHAATLDFGGHEGRLVLAEDVTERLRSERALTYRATHDVVTGLPNTESLVEYLDHGLGDGAWYEVVYVHLRGMDRVSDTFGLGVGRNVLRQVAARFAAIGGAHGMVAHRPGERFIVAINDATHRDDIVASLLGAVTEPVVVNDTLHTLDPQLGSASHPADGRLASQVIAAAALAAHLRVDDDHPIQVFAPSMAERSVERLTMASRIRQAIDSDELVMYFQPIVDAATGTVRKLEALVRWPQPDGTSIPPGIFIPLCEETGLIVPLGRWTLDAAAQACLALAAAGYGNLPVAINVSAVQFQRTDVAAQVRATTEAHHLSPEALQVELTESSLMEQERAVPALRALRSQGTQVALDDFGTGFSSMAYLRDLPIDSLKIDRSFVVDVDTDERAASICRSIIALAHTLGMTVVAEGVERERQYAWLRENGCDQIQGYHIVEPMPLAGLLAYLATHPRSAHASVGSMGRSL
ncbi:bifunctional diguanylate cyclase/phosphodiesterase [Luteibacter yeojuensis]|uniref:EAL domain-containing protein n=1 Tax=Luteibacter yeojuensis TaxID=345309 RepID=A0A7X5QSN5_9GAMM|nr:EAL domain-containing protein [Luteibacter yeojuensis]NID14562.1 EAL domain-containing protein [Luteibacter yeojuensis]